MMYVIGVDVGTAGTKAMLVNESGQILKRAYKGYQLLFPGEGCVEQRAEDWWNALVETVGNIVGDVRDKDDIPAISVSSQGGCLVPVDEDGNPMSNAISWMDRRGHLQYEELMGMNDNSFYYGKTGWGLAYGLNLVKMKWLKDNEKSLFNSAGRFLSTVDYINLKLTGTCVMDPGNGAMTQMMNVRKDKWDAELLDIIGLDEARLPRILRTCSPVGRLNGKAASDLGLGTSTMVFCGGHDQYCTALGAGAFKNGDILLSTGTAWVILGILNAPLVDTENYLTFGPHIVNGLWGALSSITAAGAAIEWFRNIFAYNENFGEIDAKASAEMFKSKDLYFYPYFNGRGYPRWNSRAKAGLVGLGLEHDKYDIVRAIMEGVAFEAGYILEEYIKKGFELNSMRIAGGASRSALWTDIIANVVGREVIKIEEADTACVGAAIIAGTGCGIFNDYADGYMKMSGEKACITPDKSRSDYYKEKFEKYKCGLEYIDGYSNKVWRSYKNIPG